MFKSALKILPVNTISHGTSVAARQLDCNITIQDAAVSISNYKNGNQVISITGHQGSGRSTYAQALIQEIIQNGFTSESDVLYLEIGQYDSNDSLWNSGIEIARSKGDRDTVALLASSATKQEAKLKAVVTLLNNFKVICFDNWRDGDKNSFHLSILSLMKSLSTIVLCISNLNHQPENAHVYIQVNGLSPGIISRMENVKVTEVMESSYKRLLYNPKAIQLYMKSYLEFGVYEVTELSKQETPLSRVLDMIWQLLSPAEQCILVQLRELRQPLPIRGDHVQSQARIIRIGLVKYEAVNSGEGNFGMVSISNCVQDFVHDKGLVDSAPSTGDKQFDILDLWRALLGPELQGLVVDAKSNSWPFIPEKWQYVTNAGAKESYNVKDLLTQKCHDDFPHLSQFDILQECLHHSIMRKDYENMAAIIFVLDRFIYWQGGSKMLLSIVDSIMKGNPLLPIAPQLVIRKARILRTTGDLQGAEKVLDKLLYEKEKLGVWQYKEKHDHHLVKAVCIQIKGEIQASLGQWLTAATNLLDSINLFKTLPKMDKKGLSCSLGLLVNTLQNMSSDEYQDIATRYSLVSPHPYLQAYDFACEAARMAMFTPLFFARHKRRAGEMMLEYSLINLGDDRTQFLNKALEELNESLKAHKSIESLDSREQYYEFIAALYKTSCVYEMREEHKTAKDLKALSILLYDQYCRNQTLVVHDSFSQRLINNALFILGLPVFTEDEATFGAVHAIPKYCQGQRQSDNKESSEQSMDCSTVDRCATTLQTVSISKLPTVDRLKTTIFTVEEDVAGSSDSGGKTTNDGDLLSDTTVTTVYECESSRYDAVHSSWRTQRTLVYIGEQLNLRKGKKGAQRDPFMVECLNQDEPLGKYVGKRYKKLRDANQYKEDVHCQMTARYYVGLFNQDLYHKDIEVSHIQFLPVVMLRLLDATGEKILGEKTSGVYNVEPYMDGNFTKLTTNWSFVEKEGQGSKLVLAFSHYTYERSNQTLIIVDHQGWTSSDHLSTTFLTDPQIHSDDRKLFGTGNLGKEGIANFWEVMHTECNEICQQLGLRRPRDK